MFSLSHIRRMSRDIKSNVSMHALHFREIPCEIYILINSYGAFGMKPWIFNEWITALFVLPVLASSKLAGAEYTVFLKIIENLYSKWNLCHGSWHKFWHDCIDFDRNKSFRQSVYLTFWCFSWLSCFYTFASPYPRNWSK